MAKRRSGGSSEERPCESAALPLNAQLIPLVLLVFLTLGIYLQTGSYEFTNWDDPMLILNNRDVRSLTPAAAIDIFTPQKGHTFQPLRVLSYAIDYKLGGNDYNPRIFHLVNVAFHLSAVLLLFAAVRAAMARLPFTRELAEEKRLIAAALCAGLFAAHPVNVESVAWCASRKYGLLATFSFSSFWLFILGTSARPRVPYLIGSFACFVLAILSSPFGVVIPLLMGLYLYCLEADHSPLAVISKHRLALAPYLAGFVIAVPALAILLIRSESGGVSTDFHTGSQFDTLVAMLSVVTRYAGNLVAPLWLNNRYPNYTFNSPFNLKVMLGVLLLIGPVIAGIMASWPRRKAILFCLGWTAICLAPVSNLIPISTLIADRYLYLAAVGLFFGLATLLAHLLPTKGFIAVSAALLACYGALAFQRTQIWESSLTLWRDSLQKDSRNDIALNNMGTALKNVDRHADSIEWYEKCLALNPNYVDAHANLGAAYIHQGLYAQAQAPLKKAITLDPKHHLSWYNLGVCFADQKQPEQALESYQKAVALQPDNVKYLTNLGAIYFARKDYKSAEHHYQKALQIEPGLPEAAINLGNVFLMRRNTDKARACYRLALQKTQFIEARIGLTEVDLLEGNTQKAIAALEALRTAHPDDRRISDKLLLAYRRAGDQASAESLLAAIAENNPNDIRAILSLGDAALKQGRTADALAKYRQALTIAPDHAAANNMTGLLLFQAGKPIDAAAHFKRAIAARPTWADPLHGLASCYFQSKEYDKSIALYQQAIEYAPNHPQAWSNLGATLLAAGRPKEAIPALEKALELNPNNANAKQYLKHAKSP